MQTHFVPFPKLYTARLELRALVPTDAPEIFVFRSDLRMLEFIGRAPAKTVEEAEGWMQTVEKETTFWGITLKNSPRLIGTICLWNLAPETATAEIGYVLHPDFWGQGIMQEALVSVVAFGFEVMEARIIEAHLQPGNLRSARLVERNGFVLDGEKDGYLVYVLTNSGGSLDPAKLA